MALTALKFARRTASLLVRETLLFVIFAWKVFGILSAKAHVETVKKLHACRITAHACLIVIMGSLGIDVRVFVDLRVVSPAIV